MPKYSVGTTIEVDAANEFGAKHQVIALFDKDKMHSLVVNHVVPTRTAYDDYADAKAAFYAACETGHRDAKSEAYDYLDAAVKALHQRQLDTVQLMSVWQDVKPYL
jgi:hypothetical protein